MTIKLQCETFGARATFYHHPRPPSTKNQVWSADITYIPVHGGCAYLVAIIDWHSRRVLSWELSNTLDAGFCARALRRGIAQYGTPEIFNTD